MPSADERAATRARLAQEIAAAKAAETPVLLSCFI
jgi:hypothetical protein